MKDYDICILGAGIAGLYCARELSKVYPKSKICILEKYKFIGGRISTFRETIPELGPISWEAGAGRIHKSHTDVLTLIKEYKLNLIPISGDIELRTEGLHQLIEFDKYFKTISSITELPPTTISKMTLKKVLEQTLGKSQATNIIDTYEYRSEIDTLKADDAIQILTKELGQTNGFYVVQGGFSGLIAALKKDVESSSVKILREHEVLNIESVGAKYRVIIKDTKPIRASKVIVALPRDAVAALPCFKDLQILKQVKMRPLVRMYAIFPMIDGKMWFHDIKKFICATPVRYVIPIDSTKGIIMISYTDGDDALYWMNRIEELGEDKVLKEIMLQIRGLFPTMTIPDPIYFKTHIWNDGCSYWTPGNYSSELESNASLIPLPDSMPGVYMCGESWAQKQCWVQSALTSAKELLKVFSVSESS